MTNVLSTIYNNNSVYIASTFQMEPSQMAFLYFEYIIADRQISSSRESCQVLLWMIDQDVFRQMSLTTPKNDGKRLK